MNLRWEVSENEWVERFADGATEAVDYVRIDLGAAVERPWLEAARERVELIGHSREAGSVAVLDRALDLDVDFLCLAGGAGDLDPRRLPLRLMVEESCAEALEGPSLVGAAWARRVHGWTDADPAEVAALARRERIFLLDEGRLPPRAVLEQIEPFAVVLPAGAEVPANGHGEAD